MEQIPSSGKKEGVTAYGTRDLRSEPSTNGSGSTGNGSTAAVAADGVADLAREAAGLRETLAAAIREHGEEAIERIDARTERSLFKVERAANRVETGTRELAKATETAREELDRAISSATRRMREAEERMSKKGVRRDAQRLAEELEGARGSLCDEYARQRDELAKFAEQRRVESLDRIATARADAEKSLAEAAAAARAEIRREADDLTESRTGPSALDPEELESRLRERLAEAEREARRRIAEEAARAAARLDEADRAQRRAERINAAALKAEEESRQRVREAEERLLEVLELVRETELEASDGPETGPDPGQAA
jgi:chromosome segregation ATPase